MRIRLTPFGRALIITILCMIAAFIIESMIEDQYLREISTECQKKGYYKTRKIYMTCKIDYTKF